MESLFISFISFNLIHSFNPLMGQRVQNGIETYKQAEILSFAIKCWVWGHSKASIFNSPWL
jgi:hypothetical protein